MNDTDLAGQIRRDLWTIVDNYDETLEPVRRGSGSHVTASTEPPLPIGAHVLDARAEASRDLVYWARFLLDEVKDVNGGALQHGPTSTNVGALVPFVARWVDWLIANLPDDADNLAADAHDHASKLTEIVAPKRREWVTVGDCPLTIAKDGESVTCGHRLRAYPGKEFITCKGCGHEDTMHWWRAKVIGHRPQFVTAMELTDILLVDLRITVEPETVRQWHKRGKVERHGRDERGRPLYDWAEVVAEIQTRRIA